MICYQGSGFETLEKSGVLLIMLGKYFSHCSSIAIFPYALGFLFSKIVYSFKKELLHILMLCVLAQERSDCFKAVF